MVPPRQDFSSGPPMGVLAADAPGGGRPTSAPEDERKGPSIAVLRDLLARLRHNWVLAGGHVLLVVLLVLLTGTALFARAEHIGYFQAFYWAVTTASTVGYGDVVPTNTRAKLVAIGMMVLAVPLLGLSLADIASGLVEGRLKKVLGMSVKAWASDFILVLGWSAVAAAAVQNLLERGTSVMVLADVETTGIDHPSFRFLHGDPSDEPTLERMQPERARAAMLCHEHDGDLLVAAIALHRIAPELPILAVPARRSTSHALRELGIVTSYPSTELLGYVLSRGGEAPHAGALIWQLVSDRNHIVQESAPTREEVGQPLTQVRAGRAGRGELVLGLLEDGQVRFALDDTTVRADDRLLLLRSLRHRSHRS